MKTAPFSVVAILLLPCTFVASAAEPELRKMTWQVDDVTREALVYIPADASSSTPVIFAFHGHGGNSQSAARSFAFHTLWPEAICVYPQGLATKTTIDPQGRLPGWQKTIGDQEDRDLHFFDAMIATFVKDDHADAKRVFVSGFSNGAFFTYCLLSARPDAIAAIAPIAGLSNEKDFQSAKPKPIFHVAGEKDPLVHIDQQQITIQRDLKLDHCDADGKPAGPMCTRYSSQDGSAVVTYIHPGGHVVPKEAPQRIVEFFKHLDDHTGKDN